MLEILTAILLQYGLLGLSVFSFLSSLVFIPGATEAFLPFFVALKFNPFLIFLAVSSGSIAGGVVDYYLGIIGANVVHQKDFKKTKKWLNKWGDLSVAVTSFVPGFPFDIVAVVVGFLRMDFKIFFLSMSIGKILKYAIIIFGVEVFLKFLPYLNVL